MRGGFSKSSGLYVESRCNIEGNANYQAKYVRTVLDYMTQQPYVDRARIVVMGQSHGGITSVAFSTEPYEGVRVGRSVSCGHDNLVLIVDLEDRCAIRFPSPINNGRYF